MATVGLGAEVLAVTVALLVAEEETLGAVAVAVVVLASGALTLTVAVGVGAGAVAAASTLGAGLRNNQNKPTPTTAAPKPIQPQGAEALAWLARGSLAGVVSSGMAFMLLESSSVTPAILCKPPGSLAENCVGANCVLGPYSESL
jgi:hypothetical protein